MTITQLAHLQEALEESNLTKAVQIAAITYDPDFDSPKKIQQYGANRGLVFHETAKARRVIVSNFQAFKQYFQLQASYQENLVSFHSVELYILDKQGRIAFKFPRMGWNKEAVIGYLRGLLEEG